MNTPSPTYHMSMEDFEREGQKVLEWIARYYRDVHEFPVLSRVRPGEIRSLLPPAAPERGESFDDILKDLDRIIVPGLTHWQSPNFYAYFPTGVSGPSILADMVTSGLAVQGMLWSTSPACTELETHVLDWLAEMLDLPAAFRSSSKGGGVILDAASSAVLCALVAAREKATGFQSNESGPPGNLVVYVSSQTHSSVEKAAKIAGYGRRNIRVIEVDESFAMRPDALEKQIAADRKAGLAPAFVCATVGSTASNAFDPLPAVGEICTREGVWLHVDGAMSGTAAVCPEFRYLHKGLEFADSYCFNPHKWMFTNFDCTCFYVADRESLVRSLTILPEYLRNTPTDSGAVIDYRDWQIPLGRRFRSLKLWFVLRWYGVEGIRHHIREHVSIAQEFKQWVEESGVYALAAPAPLNLVCFRHADGNDRTRKIMETLNSAGKMFLSHGVLNGGYVIRFCVGQAFTARHHVEKAWKEIRALG